MRSAVLVTCLLLTACSRSSDPVRAAANIQPRSTGPAKIDPYFDSKFWSVWGDGQAELAGYDLTFPRYNQLRKGTAVAIFVTETFSNSLRVKADPGKHGPADEFPVMKLNLVKDYQTGIYDYNDMLSAFVALAPVNRRMSATITKASFSSQEWCGHVYSQVLFGETRARWMRHSYFDGEADDQRELDYPENGFSEDGLLLWARGMARPFMSAGSSDPYLILTSLETSRGKHIPLSWNYATLSKDAASQTVRVPAGTFEVEVARLTRKDKSWRAFYVEKAFPHRVIKWENSEGEKAELLGIDRMKYWEMNKEGGEKALERLGIPPQARVRTPSANTLRQ
jgi:hypothetical protein